MITAEIRINTGLIGIVYARNIKQNTGYHVYDVQYYTPGKEELIKFKVQHKREEGASKLMKIIFTKISKIEEAKFKKSKIIS